MMECGSVLCIPVRLSGLLLETEKPRMVTIVRVIEKDVGDPLQVSQIREDGGEIVFFFIQPVKADKSGGESANHGLFEPIAQFRFRGR